MRYVAVLILCCVALQAVAQENGNLETESSAQKKKEIQPTWIFQSPRLINANTVQTLPKHVLEFKVVHNFGDAAGTFGGLKNFFGLDNAQDIRIGFQYGLSRRVTLAAARYKGEGAVQKLYELGLKWVILQQADNDPAHPLSLALYANEVVATMKPGTNPESENAISDFSDRLSNAFQLMLARKFGRLSLQVSPTLVHRNFALPYDEKTLFALGGAMRLHLGGRYSLLLDYFHTFRNQSSIDSFKTRGVNFYDALGIGIEILTEGHVFHLNFTNATNILENRFVPATSKSWGKGQFRWGFTVSRDFHLFVKRDRRKGIK
jgi:hypothetical protein